MPVRTVFLAAFLGLVALGGLPGQALLPGSAGAAWASDEEDAIESEVEDKVESDVEDKVESDVEDRVESDVEDRVESDVEDRVESDVEDKVESDVEDKVESDVEDKVESDVEDKVESDVEDKVESDVEDKVESDVEDKVESDVEDKVESDVEDDAEAEVERKVETDVERHVRTDADRSATEDRHARRATAAAKAAARARAARSDAPSRAEEAAADSAERFIGLDVDDAGNEVSIGEWLVIASREDIAALEALGYVTRRVEPLQGLDQVLAAMEAPASFDIAEAQAAIGRAAPRAEVDYNHVYRPEAAGSAAGDEGDMPRELLPAAARSDPAPAPVGLIDTAVATTHPALRGARVHSRDFAPAGTPQPSVHGTSVLSILVGDAPAYRGLLPGTEVFAAAVFFTGPDGREMATTAGLVRALDWMTLNHVPVVNMSLAGPKNAVLGTAIDRAYDAGTVVVAAVGNRGPAAPPLYPAAFPRTIAVTALDRARHVYRLANRGAHVDFAAPGVDVRHAAGETGYGSSSGTSLAAPFVTAAIVSSCAGRHPFAACLQALQHDAVDIGEIGFDPVYGYGMIVPLDGRP